MWQNIASRSLGSNQVLLGGMMPLASAMVIKSSMLVGNMENAQAYSPSFTSFSNSPRAADAADEIDALARARVINAEQRREDKFLQERDVEFFDWGPLVAANVGRKFSVCHSPFK